MLYKYSLVVSHRVHGRLQLSKFVLNCVYLHFDGLKSPYHHTYLFSLIFWKSRRNQSKFHNFVIVCSIVQNMFITEGECRKILTGDWHDNQYGIKNEGLNSGDNLENLIVSQHPVKYFAIYVSVLLLAWIICTFLLNYGQIHYEMNWGYFDLLSMYERCLLYFTIPPSWVHAVPSIKNSRWFQKSLKNRH